MANDITKNLGELGLLTTVSGTNVTVAGALAITGTIASNSNIAAGGLAATSGVTATSFSTSPMIPIAASTYTVGVTDYCLYNTYPGSVVITLPLAASYQGRILRLNTANIAYAITSSASNVVQLSGGLSTAILPGTIGKWCELQAYSSSWYIIASN